jgi:enterochelin esterase-like enzyme
MKKIIFLLFISFLLTSCASNAQQQDKIQVHDSLKLDSKLLGEIRTINIWTPPGYATGTDSLSVLYMPDGGTNEDFPHIANTVAELISKKSIPPIIVVGIENIQRRKDLSGPTRKWKKIKKLRRLLAERKHSGLLSIRRAVS